jgi:heme-degrading monooxygenase HmoA
VFAYILRVHEPPSEEGSEFFRRFKETPGLLHAYSLQSEEDPNESVAVAIWENREAAERYLSASSLRREVDEAIPGVTRTFYTVLDSK